MTDVRSARISQIRSKGDVGPERHDEIEAIEATLHNVGGPFQVLLHSPGLAQKVMQAGAHIRLESSLTKKERQMVIAALAREIDCNYEWVAHTANARNAGISDDTLEVIRTGGDVTSLADDERDIALFVQQLVSKHRVDQELFQRLLDAHDERWLVEVAATVGQYSYIGAMLNAFDIQPVGDEAELLA